MKPQSRLVLPTVFSIVAVTIVLVLSTRGAGPDSPKDSAGAPAALPPTNGAISPQDEADALHFVIAADREIYCREYAANQSCGGTQPGQSPGAKTGASWPTPEEMFRRAAESIQSKGAEFSYALRSLHPVEARNGPQTELEERGLAFVASHPAQNYYGQEMLGGRRYFTAVYPDLWAASECGGTRDQKSASYIQGLHAGENIGGIVVRVPLEF
jgi:hypothetical protein